MGMQVYGIHKGVKAIPSYNRHLSEGSRLVDVFVGLQTADGDSIQEALYHCRLK